MPATKNLTTPAEIDTAIAEQLYKIAGLEQDIARHIARRDGKYFGYDKEAHRQAAHALSDAKFELEDLEDLYTGWARYYHVSNNNGHIHTSMNCTSCFPETQYAWRTDLSGLTPEQVVEREAYNACSVCMPIAPAEQRAARERYTAEQRDAKRAERQAKADEKLRKAAIRAQKLLAKVEAAVEDLGGWDAIDAMPDHGTGGLYEAIYGFGAFEGRKPLQDSVGSEITYQADERRNGKRPSYDKDPREVIAEAKAKGLI